MSGDRVESAMAGAAMLFGGWGFARLGWAGLKRRAPEPEPGRELTASASAVPLAWKALWLLCLLFGLFIAGCGFVLILATLFPETAS